MDVAVVDLKVPLGYYAAVVYVSAFVRAIREI